MRPHPVRVTIRLFAVLRQQAGWRERELELSSGASVEDAWRALVQMHPDLQSAREAVRFARNGEYTSPTEPLHDGDQLAFIPPVAGGSDDDRQPKEESLSAEQEPPYVQCELTPQPIADELLARLRRTVPTTADGALVVFVGQTRETPGMPAPGQEQEAARHAGQPVTGLDYEAFEEMALVVERKIAHEIEQRFGVRRLAIIHRVGRVGLGEPSVVVAAAAPHRGAAFDACRYAIDELKARAPIWKAEHYADGSVWLGAPAREGPPPAGRGPQEASDGESDGTPE